MDAPSIAFLSLAAHTNKQISNWMCRGLGALSPPLPPFRNAMPTNAGGNNVRALSSAILCENQKKWVQALTVRKVPKRFDSD